jgi:hypothetical protein
MAHLQGQLKWLEKRVRKRSCLKGESRAGAELSGFEGESDSTWRARPVANKWDERKKALEDEYFVKKEKDLLQKLKVKSEQEKKESLKELCYMCCPKCGQPLKERSFTKILVDQCSGCGGIWLDAGELETVAGREEGSWLGKLWQKMG